MKKKLKIKWKNLLLFILFLLFIITSIFGLFKIGKWVLDNNNTNTQLEDIYNKVNIEEIPDNDNTEIIEQTEEDKSNPYWDYIKMNLINVDFSELKNINNQTKGWIQVNGTNINYPFVQADNNKYYLTHSFDKSDNQAGWVFLDYRNNINNLGKNTIIYAHGRLDKTMFGSLKNILTSGWLDTSNNYVIKLSTESENTLWQVFSVYHIPTTSDYLQTEFSSDESFNTFTKMLIDRSAYNFNTSVSSTDKIITLSTCYNNTDKVVLHAKLIKQESK